MPSRRQGPLQGTHTEDAIGIARDHDERGRVGAALAGEGMGVRPGSLSMTMGMGAESDGCSTASPVETRRISIVKNDGVVAATRTCLMNGAREWDGGRRGAEWQGARGVREGGEGKGNRNLKFVEAVSSLVVARVILLQNGLTPPSLQDETRKSHMQRCKLALQPLGACFCLQPWK